MIRRRDLALLVPLMLMTALAWAAAFGLFVGAPLLALSLSAGVYLVGIKVIEATEQKGDRS